MEINAIDGPIAQQLHAEVHNSMGNTPRIFNQEQKRTYKIQLELINDEDLTDGWPTRPYRVTRMARV